MAGAFGQRCVVGAGEEALLVGKFGLQQCTRVAVHEGHHVGHHFVPPRQAAQVGLVARVVTPGQVHAREHVAHDGAFRHGWGQV